MYDAVLSQVSGADLFIACAAVADYRVTGVAPQKLKKSASNINLELTPNPDILSAVTALENKPFTLGFAAETENLEQNAGDKLKRKNLDMIAANQVGGGQTGFESDTNELLVLWSGGKKFLSLNDKSEIARQLIDLLADHYNALEQTHATNHQK
jgi:phosphopantothenoylcysteine decarboxylase/phosphopantothenate--cysteine ligase